MTISRLFHKNLWCGVLLFALPLFAQQGNKPGEKQTPLVRRELIPAAPPLSSEEALKSFKIVPGFKIEIVAAEPLVHDPVALAFDPDGRIWVLEMQGFMPDIDGRGEENPVGVVAVLEDTNGDGRMDKRTVFQDGLVMPRALMLLRDGVLVAEPPNLWFIRDTNGDGKGDDKLQIAADYATQADPKLGLKGNPEHAANSLTWALDNWIYSANHTARFRNVDGDWKREPTAFRGQWGFSQDDWGRLVYNSNSDQFRLDMVPAHYLSRNPNFPDATGKNVDPIRNNKVWPVRVTPGINRGYQTNMLRNGKLASFTAACGPVIYRGDNFPPEFYGNAFVCEPSGHLIKRNLLFETNGVVTGRHAYATHEFLASTDERFRPVNAYTAPDGTLYIVDMYRGIVQHRYFHTTYLRQQIVERKLEKPIGLGRIYRIVHNWTKPGPAPRLKKASTTELTSALSHSNGWWRDTAQRLLIERDDTNSYLTLERMSLSHPEPRTRLHALWTLEGLNRLNAIHLTNLFLDKHPKVKAAAIRLSEPVLIGGSNSNLLQMVMAQAGDTNADVRLQLALTLGEVKDSKTESALLQLASSGVSQPYLMDAVLSGLSGRELEFLEQLLAKKEWAQVRPGRASWIIGLSRIIFRERKTNRVERLFTLASRGAEWKKLAILDGMISTLPVAAKGKPPPKVKPVLFAAQPESLKKLAASTKQPIIDRMAKLSPLVTWPGQPGYVEPPPVIPLNAEQQQQFELGKTLFLTSCGACHQPHGQGQEGLAPPLVESDWVTGTEQRLIRIVLHGVRGPITVKGKQYEMEMPGLGIFDDEQLAALVTYVRREWGHTASPVNADTVKKIREAHGTREEAWTEGDLLKIQ